MVNDTKGSIVSHRLPGLFKACESQPIAEARWPNTIYIVTTKKGGAGKTETTECLEALSTMSGKRCLLVDVDDGNRGLGRRVGLDRVIKVSWDAPVSNAPHWVTKHAPAADTMIFDLGAGIDSSDLPITAYLSSIWRMLANGGARVIICAVVSTNAPTSNYIERLGKRFETLGELLVVCNNQDGSQEYPAELADLGMTKVHLGQVPSGIQAVRLSRRELLSTVIQNPSVGFTLASACMAQRLLKFAQQSFFKDFVTIDALDKLGSISSAAPRQCAYTILKRAQATDMAIKENARLAASMSSLLAPDLDDQAILAAAKSYRSQYLRYREAAITTS
ncbi:hypothetical protein M8312_13120 [Sphingomonas sp. KRR8]|uniref:hypothetical protein n=1 Tax=Sphingomonas sp. KRR8 TaxID=2942996 RepID=UPI0020227EBC|nr:hypothetical protein [Sphingomonas sp. KRR8]URD60700.1 hypothetical protein M8312_13120 [Sphingomonas sp. KRR8]